MYNKTNSSYTIIFLREQCLFFTCDLFSRGSTNSIVFCQAGIWHKCGVRRSQHPKRQNVCHQGGSICQIGNFCRHLEGIFHEHQVFSHFGPCFSPVFAKNLYRISGWLQIFAKTGLTTWLQPPGLT